MVAYQRSQSLSSQPPPSIENDNDNDDEPTTALVGLNHPDADHPNANHNISSSNRRYPYTRAEECSWQPDDVARHMSALIHPHSHALSSSSSSSQLLLSQGWSTAQVQDMRRTYGINRVSQQNNDDDDDDDLLLALLAESTNTASSSSSNTIIRRTMRYSKRLIRTTLRPIVEALMGQMQEPLILMLLGSAVLSILLGNPSDAISIAIALLIVSMVAAVQEYRSERALEQLQHLVPNTCTVVRNQGKIYNNHPALELVVGDLILLQTGDRIPADGRVVDSVELTIDESALTGEPDAIFKTSNGILFSPAAASQRNNHISLSDQQNIVFAGTLVTGGRGRAMVIAVGTQTEFGKIATALSHITTTKSPLQLKIDELSQRLAYISTAVIVLIAIVGYFMGRPILETLTIAVSLAVAAIPEGLPICVTVTLALGVLRMAKQNAIIKKLPVVESLGCTTVIASDKTGTLTQNESTFEIQNGTMPLTTMLTITHSPFSLRFQ